MRPAYSRLHDKGQSRLRGRTPTIVLGRKFCPSCGRWRHLCDFGHRSRQGVVHGREYVQTYCYGCQRVKLRAQLARRTQRQRELRREYERWWRTGMRRERGTPERNWQHRPLRPDPTAKKRMPADPLAGAIIGYLRAHGWTGVGNNQTTAIGLDWLAREAGVSDRLVHRVLHEQRWVTLDTADRLALAIDVPLALIYPEDR